MSETRIERRVVPVGRGEVRAETDDDGKVGIKGLAALFGVRTDLGPFEEEIERGAFAGALKTSDVRGLFNHDPNFVLGRTKSKTMTVAETDDGLSYDIPSLPKSRADVAEAIDRGDVDGNSFSFTVKVDEWTRREDGKDLRVIKEFEELFDLGPVTFPAYPDTTVALRSRDMAIERGDLPNPNGSGVHITATSGLTAEMVLKIAAHAEEMARNRYGDVSTATKAEDDATATAAVEPDPTLDIKRKRVQMIEQGL